MIVSRLSYIDRIPHCQSSVAKKLLHLIDSKQTNLAISADVTSSSQLLDLANQLGPEICLLKTHIDIVDDFTPALTDQLASLARQHQFLIFEDRKFADIGNTVKHQYGGGLFRIADWANITNAHSLPGPGIIQGLAEVGLPKERGLILLAEMSSAGHLMDTAYVTQTLHMAEQFPDFVFGFITQRALSSDPKWIHLTPGVNLKASGDNLGQQYVTPKQAILQNGSDVIIVGRGILSATDPRQEARHYRQAGWDAYQERLNYSKNCRA